MNSTAERLTTQVPFHPAADAFPALEGAEFDALVEDIRQHGQREPIVLHNGMILDGRNRYRAVTLLSMKPKFVEWDGIGTPEAFVISKNIMRRHLTPSQRAMLVAKFTNLSKGQRADLVNTTSGLSIRQAAEIAGVSRAVVQDAKSVRERGTPEQIAAVETGAMGARTAVDQIKTGRTDEEMRQRRRDGDIKRQNTRKGMTKLWFQFRDGIDKISSLPEVGDIIDTIPAASWETYGRRASAALDWLQQFNEAFNDSDRNKAR